MNVAAKPSAWQSRIEGEWYGAPSVFDVSGNHVGHIKVTRSSVFEDGRTTYLMDTRFEFGGPLRARFESAEFAFGVRDGDQDRVYLGPDFVGAGHPSGALVDAHYYSPAWTSDLRTLVHILPDGRTQVYSSQLYDGPAMTAVFNGLYRVATDYESNPDTRAAIDRFIAAERIAGPRPHVLPPKRSGVFTGVLEVHGPDRQRLGTERVRIRYRPQTLLRSKMEVDLSGVVERRYEVVRHREGNRHVFEGPDVFGNAMAYGRALYTSQHFFGEALKLKGREFLIDDACGLSVVWHWFASDRPTYTMFGVLAFEPGDDLFRRA